MFIFIVLMLCAVKMPESSSVFATLNDSVFAGGFKAIKFGSNSDSSYVIAKSSGLVEKKKNDESMVVIDSNGNPVFKISSSSTSAYSKREVIALLKERECPFLMIEKQVT